MPDSSWLRRFGSLLASKPFLTLAALILLLTLPDLGKLFCIVFFAIVAVLRSSGLAPAYESKIVLGLGIGVSLIPALGSGVLLVAFVMMLLCLDIRNEKKIEWASPFLLILAAWTLFEFIFGSDIKSLEIVAQGHDGGTSGGIFSVLKSFEGSTERWIVETTILFRFVVLAAVFSFFSSREDLRKKVIEGAAVGALVASAIIIFESSGIADLLPRNSNPYWISLGRVAGTFTDPNSAGVFLALMVPFLAVTVYEKTKKRTIAALSIVVVLIAGALTGSRSFFLGVLIYLLLLVVADKRRRILFSCGALCLIVVILSFSTQIESSEFTPVGVKRVIESFAPSTAKEALFSRNVFFQISSNVWLDHSWLGVGLANFPDYVVSYAEKLNFATGTWSDNANSFYLEVFAELGVLGAIALILSLMGLRWKRGAELLDRTGQQSAILLLGLFVTGPHLAFDEVAILVGIILAVGFEQKSRSYGNGFETTFLLIAVFGIGASSYFLERGFYPWESDSRGQFRWTARVGQTILKCGNDGANFEVSLVKPPRMSRAPILTLTSPYQEIEVGDGHALDKVVHLACPLITEKQKESRTRELPVRFKVDTVWTPLRNGVGHDLRLLGVKQRKTL